MRGLIFIIVVFCMSGCIARSVDVKKNSENIAINSKNISKAFDLIGTYHKNDANDNLRKEMQDVAKATFEESLKSKGLTVNENLPKAVKTAGSITESLGVPYGGLAADILIAILGLFGGKKGVDVINASVSKRKKEEEDWKLYLASLTPDEADKAIKANGI